MGQTPPEVPSSDIAAFQPPPDGWGGGPAGIDWPGDEVPEDPGLRDLPAVLLEAHAAAAEAIRQRGPNRAPRSVPGQDGRMADDIIGVGIGSATVEALRSGVARNAPGSPVLRVSVTGPATGPDVRSALVRDFGVDAARSDALDVVPILTKPIEMIAHDFVDRPAPGGISVGNAINGGVGTLGCLVTGRRPPRSSNVYILSANHVLARQNQAVEGECICQPGVDDFGSCPEYQVAVLERFVTIYYGGGAVNYADAAVGWAWPDRVRSELVARSPSGVTYFPVSRQPVSAVRGMAVGKSGRTTELTVGNIVEDAWSGWVPYVPDPAFFAGMLRIQSTSGSFADRGDSGSLVWTWDGNTNPVGLLVWRTIDGIDAFANRIEFVLGALDVDIIGF